MIQIGQSDLGLLDRSYYLNESDVTKAYRQYIRNFALAFATDKSMINSDVAAIFEFEKKIAMVIISYYSHVLHLMTRAYHLLCSIIGHPMNKLLVITRLFIRRSIISHLSSMPR